MLLGLGWVGLGWVGLGWVGLGWAGLVELLLQFGLANGPQFRYSRQKKPFLILTDRRSVIGRNSSKTNLFSQK
ncbi:hypothetical protein C2I18_22285 [Paenibacillus sp. PK3_47]|nr:hypothetical protein C2I18_22285 [Paenibacillus sp. PK3_47]